MRGLNKVFILGNMGADPETRVTTSGKTVVNFRVATNKSYKDRDGNIVQKAEWHNVVAWERSAEIIAEFCKKGSQILIEGELQTRQWEDQDGNTRYTTEIVCREFTLLGGNREASEDEDEPAAKPKARAKAKPKEAEPSTDPEDEDLPF